MPHPTNPDEANILRLWHEGHGTDAISLKLRIHSGIVRRTLREHQLHRTPSQARAIRKQNGLVYYIRDGLEEPPKPRKQRYHNRSMYEMVDTEGGLSPEDLERAFEL